MEGGVDHVSLDKQWVSKFKVTIHHGANSEMVGDRSLVIALQHAVIIMW